MGLRKDSALFVGIVNQAGQCRGGLAEEGHRLHSPSDDPVRQPAQIDLLVVASGHQYQGRAKRFEGREGGGRRRRLRVVVE
jgi:hypothetical protein